MKVSVVCLCLILKLSYSSGWENEKLYEYLCTEIRTEVPNGINWLKSLNSVFKKFQFKWDSHHNALTGKLFQKKSPNFPEAPQFIVPEESFQAVFKDGLVTELTVSQNTRKWDVETVRGILGAFQISDLVKEKDDFVIMEESVAGICETSYTVDRKDEENMTVRKSKNYTNCQKIPVFERGVYGKNYDVLMKENNIINRSSSVEYEIVNGILQRFRLKERIELKSGNDSKSFDNEIEFTKSNLHPRDIEAFLANLDNKSLVFVPVGGLMYNPKNQIQFCEIKKDFLCKFDYYMNLNEFEEFYDWQKVIIAKKLAAKNLVEKIAKELETPSEVPRTNTLESFTNLIGVMRKMSLDQLEEISKTWKLDSRDILVFQNALVLTGTLDALKIIKNLNKNDEFLNKGNLRILPEIVHPLSLGYLDFLFEFATDPELIKKDPDLAKDLILDFTNLLRRYQTEKEKPFREGKLKNLIRDKYSVYISDKLSESLNVNNDINFQIYTRALGNMADFSIFKVYLCPNFTYVPEFQTTDLKLTEFQKTHLINSMDKTVEMYPEKSKEILMKVYSNSEESFSVRVAAAYQLFKTNLSEGEIFEIIKIAKDSDSEHTRSAVKTSILSQAYDYHTNEKIVEMAKSINVAVDEYPKEQGRPSRHEFMDLSNDITKIPIVSEFIGGYDNNPMSSFAYGLQNRNGFKTFYKFGVMINNFQDYIKRFFSMEASKKSSANIEFDYDFAQYFQPFTNLKFSRQDLLNFLIKDRTVNNFFIFMDEVMIGFPTETGFPFLYSYQAPELVYAEGSMHVDESFDNVKAHINFVYSSQEQIKFGFVNPFNRSYHLYGANINRQINVPLNFSYNSYAKTHVVTVNPLFRKENQRIVHLSTWPYSGIRDLFPIEPTPEDTSYTQPDEFRRIEKFNGEKDLDNSGRFKVEVVSFEMDKNGKIDDYYNSKEFLRYNYTGLFGHVVHHHNIYNFFFNEDKNYPTSLVFRLASPVIPQVKFESEMIKKGIFAGPYIFVNAQLFQSRIDFTGPTNHSVTLAISQGTGFRSPVIKFHLQGSYSQNDTQISELCADIYAGQQRRLTFSSSNSQVSVFSEYKFGETCAKGGFVTLEYDLDLDKIIDRSGSNLNVTMDFNGLPEEIAVRICEFHGYMSGDERVKLGFNLIQKDPKICEKLLNKNNGTETVASTESVVIIVEDVEDDDY